MKSHRVYTKMPIRRKRRRNLSEPLRSKGWSTCMPFSRTSILWGYISPTLRRASLGLHSGCVYSQCFRTLWGARGLASFQRRSRMELAHAHHWWWIDSWDGWPWMPLRLNRSSTCASHASWRVLPRVFAYSSFRKLHFVGVCVGMRILSECLHLGGRRWIRRRITPFLHPIVGIECADWFLSPLGSWAFESGKAVHSSSSSGRFMYGGSGRWWKWRSIGICRS